MMFRRIVDGGIKKPVALASNHAQREIFVFDQVSAKVTFLSDSGRFITQISTKQKTDLTGMVHFAFSTIYTLGLTVDSENELQKRLIVNRWSIRRTSFTFSIHQTIV